MRFGPAGYPRGSKGPEDALEILRRLELDAMEMEYVRGVRTSAEKAEQFGRMAKERGMRLTAHAPYFISLNSDNDETRKKSLGWIMDTVRAAHRIGAYSVAMHAASYGKNKDKATENVIAGLTKCRDMMDDEGIADVTLGLETMGKASVWGTLAEIAAVADAIEGVRPVLDVSHIHARDNGCLKNRADMKETLGEFFATAGDRPHFHISCIKYGGKGEISHLPLSAKDPDMGMLAGVIAEHYSKKDCTFICESPLLEEDAVVFKNMFSEP